MGGRTTKTNGGPMKNELILSSLLLTAQITPAAMASTAVQNEINKNLQATTFKTPLMKIDHPFKDNAVIEAYAVLTIEKDSYAMNDISFGKVTHKLSVQLFDKDNQEIEDFKIDDSEEGGFYAELRGATDAQKTFILWTCSSTMNCGYSAPGFLHIYLHDRQSGVLYNDLQLPVFSSEAGNKTGRIAIYFDSKEKILK